MLDTGYPKYRARQIFQWIYKDVEKFKDMKTY